MKQCNRICLKYTMRFFCKKKKKKRHKRQHFLTSVLTFCSIIFQNCKMFQSDVYLTEYLITSIVKGLKKTKVVISQHQFEPPHYQIVSYR